MAASASGATFDTGHSDQIHDAQLDYYGRRLATASSDRTIRLFDVVGEQHAHLADLRGHEGPVWQVAWAHPKFGALLASCAFDHRVIVWKEGHDGQWQQARAFSFRIADGKRNGGSSFMHQRGWQMGPKGERLTALTK